MTLSKQKLEALKDVLPDNELKDVKALLPDDAIEGWSVFDQEGIEKASDGISEMVTAVCSNVLDLADSIGAEIDEASRRPSISFLKGSQELHVGLSGSAHVLVLRDNASSQRKGA